MTTLQDLIAELERLDAAATKGPWSRCGASGGKCPCGLIWARDADLCVAVVETRGDCGDGPLLPTELIDAHKGLIELIGTHRGAILAKLRRLERAEELLRLAASGLTYGPCSLSFQEVYDFLKEPQ